MQRQVTKIMLNTELQSILDHAAELKKTTAANRKKMAEEALLAEQNKLEVLKNFGSREGGRPAGRRSSLAARLVDTLDAIVAPESAAARRTSHNSKNEFSLRQATRAPAPKAKVRSIRSRFRPNLGGWKKNTAPHVTVVKVDLQSADPNAAQL